jgi:hypothetical protein
LDQTRLCTMLDKLSLSSWLPHISTLVIASIAAGTSPERNPVVDLA